MTKDELNNLSEIFIILIDHKNNLSVFKMNKEQWSFDILDGYICPKNLIELKNILSQNLLIGKYLNKNNDDLDLFMFSYEKEVFANVMSAINYGLQILFNIHDKKEQKINSLVNEQEEIDNQIKYFEGIVNDNLSS